MAETSLITKTDVEQYRDIDSKIKQARFDSFLMDVQRKNLRNLLGNALYYAFMNEDRTIGVFKDLLDGKDYSYNSQMIHYYGLKPVLSYWLLAMMTREGELFHSSHGAIQLVNNPQQNFESAKEKERIAVGYMETAQTYANDAILFLNTNSSLYPLWAASAETNQTNFVSFKL